VRRAADIGGVLDLTTLVAVSMKSTAFDPIATTAMVRWSGEKPMPCTRSWPLYSGLKLAGSGSPSRMTPRSLLSTGSVTDTVLENCSAA
jgi:hypothetical protein